MGFPELKNKVLLQVENADERLLTRLSDFIDSNLENNTIKDLLEISEKEYQDGKNESYENIIRESKEKYFHK
jgi:hypothetical protein